VVCRPEKEYRVCIIIFCSFPLDRIGRSLQQIVFSCIYFGYEISQDCLQTDSSEEEIQEPSRKRIRRQNVDEPKDTSNLRSRPRTRSVPFKNSSTIVHYCFYLMYFCIYFCTYGNCLYFVNRSFNLDVEVESPLDLLISSNSKLQNVSSTKTGSMLALFCQH
jgi:hypothetical protein